MTLPCHGSRAGSIPAITAILLLDCQRHPRTIEASGSRNQPKFQSGTREVWLFPPPSDGGDRRFKSSVPDQVLLGPASREEDEVKGLFLNASRMNGRSRKFSAGVAS